MCDVSSATHFHLGRCSTSIFVDAPTSWAPLNPSFRAGMWEYFENRLPLFAYQSPLDTPSVAHVPGNGSKLTLM